MARINISPKRETTMSNEKIRLSVAPRDVMPGDVIPGHYDGKPVKNVSVNPRGCKGKTHIDGGCWDNAGTVDILR